MLTLILETIRDWVQSVLARFHSMYLGYVTPQMYGAVGDGVHDDTQAIQQAVTNAKMGDVIYFPHGKYNVSETITIDKSLSFIGDTIRVGSTDWGTPNCDSVIQYSGTEPNITLFKAAPQFRNISFKGLTFVGNSFKVRDNSNRPNTFPRPIYTDDVLIAGINGVDLYPNVNNAVSFDNCIFYGFSGFAVKIGQHQYVNDCSFSNCYDAIQTTMDSVVSNCWFSRDHNAIKAILAKEQKDGNADKYYTAIASDVWADQLSGHFLDTEGGSGMTTCFFDNVNIDLVDESVFNSMGGFNGGRIHGKVSRFGLTCEDISDGEKTEELIPKSCAFYGKQYKNLTIDLIESDMSGERKIFECTHNSGDGLFTGTNSITINRTPWARVFGEQFRFQGNNIKLYTKDGVHEYYEGFWYINGSTEFIWDGKGNLLAPRRGVYSRNTRTGELQISTDANDKQAWEPVVDTHRLIAQAQLPNASLSYDDSVFLLTSSAQSNYQLGGIYQCRPTRVTPDGTENPKDKKWYEVTETLYGKATYVPAANSNNVNKVFKYIGESFIDNQGLGWTKNAWYKCEETTDENENVAYTWVETDNPYVRTTDTTVDNSKTYYKFEWQRLDGYVTMAEVQAYIQELMSQQQEQPL